MSLVKKSLELPMINGLDTKTDPKQIKIGKLQSAENCEFDRPGKIIKRKGFNVLSNTVIDGGTITNGQGLATYNKELVAFDDENIYTWVDGVNGWKDKGNFQSIYLESIPVTNGTYQDLQADIATIDTLQAYVFLRDEGLPAKAAYYQVLDTVTNTIVVGPTLINSAALLPKVISCGSPTGDVFVIYYFNTADGRLYKGVLPKSNLTATVSYTAITDPLGSGNANTINHLNPAYDVKSWSAPSPSFPQNQIYLAYGNALAPFDGITIKHYDSAAATVAVDTVDFTGDGVSRHITLVFNDNSWGNTEALIVGVLHTTDPGSQYVGFYGYSEDLSINYFSHLYDIEFGLIPTPTIGTMAVRISGCNFADPSLDLFAIGVDFVFDTAQTYTRTAISDPLGGTITWTPLARGQTALAATPFVYLSKAYFPIVAGANIVSPTNPTDSSYYLIDTEGNVVARWYRGIAGGIGNYTFYNGVSFVPSVWLPSTEQLSSTVFNTALMNRTSFPRVSGKIQTGIFSPSFDFFEPERSYSTAQIAQSLYVGGGMLFQYDGLNLVEDGFNWDPTIFYMSTTSLGAANSYSYVAVWEWVDNNGLLHRSSPSIPYVLGTNLPIGTGGGTSTTTNISISPLTLTYKNVANLRTPPNVVLYRTKSNGSIYYRLPVDANNANKENVIAIILSNDNTPDTALDSASSPPLYTTGEVGNDAPPPVGAMTVYRDRLFVLDSTNPLVIYYTKKVNFAQTAEFSDSQLITVDPKGGPITGLASMDDKLIIFKENSIRYISGQGPNPDGTNDDYGSTTLITTDAGCTNSRSIVSTPDGLLFKSSKGIYFLNRGLQVSYIGAPVEKWNNDFITSAVLMQDKNQVRFTLDSGISIVYDYYVDTWATFTNIDAVQSVVWDSQHTYIKSNGSVFKQGTGWTDNGVGYSMELTSGWIPFGGIQGFQRLYKLILLGDYGGNHFLEANLSYDYNDTTTQTITVNPNPAYLYQYELRPARQKCMSVRFQIKENITAPAILGEGYELSNIRLDYGVIGGSNRVRDGQIAG